MPKPIDIKELGFEISSTMADHTAAISPNAPFRIAVLGDFTGRASRGEIRRGPSLSRLRPIEVDRDSIDDLPGKMRVSLYLTPPAGGDPLVIGFESLEDFHPDRLVERLDIFKKLLEVRRQLKSGGTFSDAAAKARSWLGRDEKKDIRPVAMPNEPSAAILSEGGLLDAVLEESGPEPAEAKQEGRTLSAMDQFLRQIVAPHVVAPDDPREQELVAAVDGMISASLDCILHHPSFQALEAAWRGLHFLVSRLETDDRLKVFVVDLAREELAADCLGRENPRLCTLFRPLVEEALYIPNPSPWAVIAGDYTFGPNKQDTEILGCLARLAAMAGAPFLAGGAAAFIGCASLDATPDPDDWRSRLSPEVAQAWARLRLQPEAGYIGLALPRPLLRLPYGAKTEPVEMFDFEEMETRPRHDTYLWGNPAYLLASLLGRGFTEEDWQLRPGSVLETDGLPLHVYKIDGETEIKPCAEVLLTQRAAERILDLGFMPLLSFKHQDVVRLGRFQSIADPPTRLAGRWEK